MVIYQKKAGRGSLIKYGYIEGEQRFFFVLFYIDVYDRSIIDYYIGLSCSEKDALQTLKRALLKRQQFDKLEKPVMRTDNGPQFFPHALQKGFETTLKMEHERIPPKTPNMNAHIESLHRILENECFSRFQFETYEDAYREDVYEILQRTSYAFYYFRFVTTGILNKLQS